MRSKTFSGNKSRESRHRRHAGSCKIILGVFRQKEYQQFRLKKPGGAGVKLFQAILAVNRDPGGTPVPGAVNKVDVKADML